MELSDEMMRHLRSTILVDSGKAISFVSERNHGTEEEDTETDGDSPESSVLTGEEASEFYQEVLSLPQQNSRVIDNRKTTSRCRNGKSVKTVKTKRTEKPKVSLGSKVGSFQLFQYAQDNEVELFQSAISSGHFDVDMQDNFHWTLLMVAAYAGHWTIVECLLKRGAKWQEYSDRGMNAADLARSRGHVDLADLIESFDSRHQDFGGGGEVEGVQYPETSGQGSGKKRTRKFYCKSCQAVVTQSPRVGHDTSIVHLYSCQHPASSLVPYGIPESNRGFQMLLRSGWNPKKGLGSHRQGQRFPVKTVLKQDRLGFGVPGGKAKVTHFSAHDREAVRSHRDKHKKEKRPSKNKKDILQEQHRERQWERRVRTIMNHEESLSHLFT